MLGLNRVCLYTGVAGMVIGGLLIAFHAGQPVCRIGLVVVGAGLFLNELRAWHKDQYLQMNQMRKKINFKMPNHVPGDW